MFGNGKDKQTLAEAEEHYRILHRNRIYGEDLLVEKDLQAVVALEDRYRVSLRAKDGPALDKLNQENQKLSRRLFPPTVWDVWRENVEVILVAVLIALAIRTYFVQPFKIPTGSMFPTLYGITPTVLPPAEEPPSLPMRAWDMVIAGRSYSRLVTAKGGQVQGMRAGQWFLWFEYTDFEIGDETFRVWLNIRQVFEILHIADGRIYAPGEVVANFMVDTGDQVLVNKMTYHFRAPDRGEVFVFSTAGLPTVSSNPTGAAPTTQFFIKRCVGVPGDVLEIEPPRLIVNGHPEDGSPIFAKIFAREPGSGYGGYTRAGNTLKEPGETYTVPAAHYWAMGDNSANSQDSRYWGPVPKENLVGTALLVYWPFTKRWGLIR